MLGPSTAEGGSGNCSSAALHDPGREPLPAAVEHRHALLGHERKRQAVRRQHEQREAALGCQVAVDLRQLGAGMGVAAVRRAARATRGSRCRAPASPWPSAPGRCPAPRPAACGSPTTLAGSSSVRMPRLSDSYGPSLTPPCAGGERDARALELDLDHASSPRASAQRQPRARPRGRTPRRRACASASPRGRWPSRGDSGMPASIRSSPGDLEPHPAQVRQVREHGLRRARAWPARARAPRAARSSAARGSPRAPAPRAASRRAAAPSPPARITASAWGRPRCRSSSQSPSVCGLELTSAARPASPRSAPVSALASCAEATSSGSASRSGCERAVERQLVHALHRGRRALLAQQVHQLVAHARPGDRREARAGGGLACQRARSPGPCGSRSAPRSAAPAGGAWDRR